jgi:hypothetical protein
MVKSYTHLPTALYIAEDIMAETCSDVFSGVARPVGNISQMAFINNALHGRAVIHCSRMIINVIFIESNFRWVEPELSRYAAEHHVVGKTRSPLSSPIFKKELVLGKRESGNFQLRVILN